MGHTSDMLGLGDKQPAPPPKPPRVWMPEGRTRQNVLDPRELKCNCCNESTATCFVVSVHLDGNPIARQVCDECIEAALNLEGDET